MGWRDGLGGVDGNKTTVKARSRPRQQGRLDVWARVGSDQQQSRGRGAAQLAWRERGGAQGRAERGLCRQCWGKTQGPSVHIAGWHWASHSLPPEGPPSAHYSLLLRCAALCCPLQEGDEEDDKSSDDGDTTEAGEAAAGGGGGSGGGRSEGEEKGGAAGANAAPGGKKKGGGKSNVGQYDLNDEFIDDSGAWLR